MGIFSKLAALFSEQKEPEADEERLMIYLSKGIQELDQVNALSSTLDEHTYQKPSVRKKLSRRLLQAKIWLEKALEVEQTTRVIDNIIMETFNKGSLRMKIINSKEVALTNSLHDTTNLISNTISKLDSLSTVFPDRFYRFIRTIIEMSVSMTSLKEKLEKLVALEKKVAKVYYEAGGS